jgi:hypothetical protein
MWKIENGEWVTDLAKDYGQGLSDYIHETMLLGWPSKNCCQWRRQHNRIMEKIMVLDGIYGVS